MRLGALSGGRAGGRQRAGYLFVSGYTALLLLFGVAPGGYAIYLAITGANGQFSGLSNFFATARDFRFVPAFEHVGLFLLIWLVVLVVLVLALALMLHGGLRRPGAVFRFLFYIPGPWPGRPACWCGCSCWTRR